MTQNIIVGLSGGLGNQLFQLAAGYSISAGREIVCEVGFSGHAFFSSTRFTEMELAVIVRKRSLP
jgi:hypothetical protein